jgi:LacI family transcriptional regulator
MPKAKRLRVAVAVPQGPPFVERLLRGIADFARPSGGWTVTRLPEAMGTSIQWLRHWQGGGAFAFISARADARIARRLPFPVINLSSVLRDPGVPTVAVDHARIGELVATHLLERQFKRFGYYGAAGIWYSELRRDSFCRAVTRAGGECMVLEAQPGMGTRTWRDQSRQLERWLSTVQPPIGIMACSDPRAGMVLDTCRQLGLRVPEDVAVVGVDNDPIFSESYEPPLTSVSRNDQEVGRAAAALLERLISGAAPPKSPIFVPPDGIAERRSTETVAVEDADVAQAVRFIAANLHQPFGVEELLREVALSRRSLEYKFRNSLGTSPYEYINQVRVDAAKRLLTSSHALKLAAIATACGFADVRRFRIVFRRLVGKTPAEFRRSALAAPE